VVISSAGRARQSGGVMTIPSPIDSIDLSIMPEVIYGNLYDFPRYYDLLFGADWKQEVRFLTGCFEQFAKRPVKSVFEPACGTGRLLDKLAKLGFQVSGNDLNPTAVAYCNSRLKRLGFPATATVGDMSDFCLKQPVHAAFNLINTVRHLPTEKAMEAHLRCTGEALVKGGLYLLGLHLTPTDGPRMDGENWTARRGNVRIDSRMWTKELDLKGRNERLGISFDVTTPTKQFRIEDEMNYRTYTARQMQKLLDKVGLFDVAATFDFLYQLDDPIEVDETTEDVVYVLPRK
jgi:SAM-dependent methyltransferase